MLVSDFDFALPPELIAQAPLPERDASRLLCFPRAAGPLTHRMVRDLPQLLRAGDVLVVNDARVIPARLRGHKQGSGGKVELLLIEPLAPLQQGTAAGAEWLALGQASKALKAGTRVVSVPVTLTDGGVEAAVGRAGPTAELDHVLHVVQRVQVRAADAAGQGANQDLAGGRFQLRDLVADQLLVTPNYRPHDHLPKLPRLAAGWHIP